MRPEAAVTTGAWTEIKGRRLTETSEDRGTCLTSSSWICSAAADSGHFETLVLVLVFMLRKVLLLAMTFIWSMSAD